ncbi:MAG: 5-methylthioadenosine/S-adenosylhomocysteine deaminase, partial [Baekduia sp.]|nr:5-methylthioadenosine/S-adenosylhomocysteine deaminase [Baekduia sp.]
MGSLLLTDGYVVTVDPDRRVIPSGFVRIEGDRITGIGPMEEIGDVGEARVIPLDGMMVTPGLLNGHNHHWGSLFKNT